MTKRPWHNRCTRSARGPARTVELQLGRLVSWPTRSRLSTASKRQSPVTPLRENEGRIEALLAVRIPQVHLISVLYVARRRACNQAASRGLISLSIFPIDWRRMISKS
jgi:hypothetical protein